MQSQIESLKVDTLKLSLQIESLKVDTLKLILHVMWLEGLAPECVDSSFCRKHGIRSVSNGDVVLRTFGVVCLVAAMTCVIRLDIQYGHDVT